MTRPDEDDTSAGQDPPSVVTPEPLYTLLPSRLTDVPGGEGATCAIDTPVPPNVERPAGGRPVAGGVFGEYDLLGDIGRGGMGHVFKARHRRLDRLVALKFIGAEKDDDPATVRRFQREARAIARLAHPNIVNVFDLAKQDDVWFLVMEFVPGVTLADLVRREGPLPVFEACDYLRQAAFGLQHMFERGLVHRDVKPANIIREASASLDTIELELTPRPSASPFGRIRIVDLGLARLPSGEASSSSLTLTGADSLLGTPDYIAPEQIETPHAADIRADLYSLGCTLVYLLTGQPPFPGGSVIQKLDKHRWTQPPSPRVLRPELPEELVALVFRLLAKRPDERFQTPTAVADALLAFMPGWTPAVSVPPVVEPTAAPTLGVEVVPFQAPRQPANAELGVQVPLESVAMVRQASDPHTATGPPLVAQPGIPPRRGVREQNLTGHRQSVTCLAITRDSRFLVSGGVDGTVRLWDVEYGGEVGQFTGHGSTPVLAVTVLKHEIYSAGADGVIHVSLGKGTRALRSLRGHADDVYALALSADGRRLLSAGQDQQPRLWDLSTGRPPRRLGGLVSGRHWDVVRSVGFSPDGACALSSSRDHTIRLWDLATGKERAVLVGHRGTVYAAVFSPAGGWVLSGGDVTVRLWDAASGAEVRSCDGHANSVTCVAFTPDGRRALSGSKDHSVRLWDVETGRELHRFDDHPRRVLAVQVAPDNAWMAAAGADGVIRLRWLPG